MNETLKRFAEGRDLCDGEHTLSSNDEPAEEVRYWLTCDAQDLDLGFIKIPKTRTDASDEIRYFVSSTLLRHREDVLRAALKEQAQVKPGGLLEDLLIIGQTTNETLKRVHSIIEMQRDRLNDLEERLATAEQRLQGTRAL